MDKSNHRITVDRDYLEKLERIAESKFNMRGDVRTIKAQAGFHEPYARQIPTLFITDNELSVDCIIIVNEEGKERGKFIREGFAKIF